LLLDVDGLLNYSNFFLSQVHHSECSNESKSEPHLIDVLRKGDFIDFTQQLEGFQSIYQLNAESKIKSKAYIAIQALETDLQSIFDMSNTQSIPPEQLVLTSSVGLLTKRRGGHPMKLLFFVRPTELLNFEQKRMDSLIDALHSASVAKKIIGNSVTINLETAAPSNKLQTSPLLVKSSGAVNFTQINLNNSTMLPAAFVLRFNKPMPVTSQIIEDIKKITNNLCVEIAGVKVGDVKVENPVKVVDGSLVNLIVDAESLGSSDSGQKGLFVTLADQSHCYFITDNPEMTGVVVKSIQFTEPSHVTKIVKLLRQQALFNALIASCVRRQSNRQDFDSYMFEINVVSLQLIQIFVEHPIKESIVTVELDLTDVKQVTCKINGSDQQFDAKLENYIFRVFQKTLSIPMVLRSLIKYWDNEAGEFQRAQKRLYNSGIYGEPGNNGDEKKNGEEKEKSDDVGDDYTTSVGDVSGAFDICGINKNEIFFKTNEQKSTDDIYSSNKIPTFDLNDENDEMMMPMGEDMMNENSMDAKLMFQKSQKPMDVFEFNDPSPPPANTVMPPMQSPLAEERAKKIPTPRASPSTPFPLNIELIPVKTMEPTMVGQTSISITPVISAPNFPYEKPKSEKKKKRKRDDGDMGSPAMVKKKSSDSLSGSPSKKSSSSSIMGKPSASFKPKKSPVPGNSFDAMDDLSFLNFTGGDQQQQQVRSQFI
jgi:Mediator of RNA polymerase II transcription subunit 1